MDAEIGFRLLVRFRAVARLRQPINRHEEFTPARWTHEYIVRLNFHCQIKLGLCYEAEVIVGRKFDLEHFEDLGED